MKKTINILVFILIISFSSGCSDENNQSLIAEKIYIEKDYCIDCIGLNTIKIRYKIKTNIKINEELKSKVGKLNEINFKILEYEKDKIGMYPYELIFDEISFSKYYTLNEVKKKFSDVIYFKKIYFINSRKTLETNSKTEICYFLNGKKISENDSIEMNSPPLEKVIPLPRK